MKNTLFTNENGRFSLHQEVELPSGGLPEAVPLHIEENRSGLLMPEKIPIRRNQKLVYHIKKR